MFKIPNGMEVMMVSSDVRHSVNCPLVNALYAVLRSSRSAVTFKDMVGSVFMGLPTGGVVWRRVGSEGRRRERSCVRE